MNGKLKEELRTALQNKHYWKIAVALLAIASMMMPWIVMDGASSKMSGGDLIAYLIHGNEKWEMLKTSFLGALSIMVIPTATLAMAVMVFWKVLNEENSVLLNIITGAAPLTLLIFAGRLASSDHQVGGMLTPQPGIVVLFICQAVLAAEALITKYKDTGAEGGAGENDEGAAPARRVDPGPSLRNRSGNQGSYTPPERTTRRRRTPGSRPKTDQPNRPESQGRPTRASRPIERKEPGIKPLPSPEEARRRFPPSMATVKHEPGTVRYSNPARCEAEQPRKGATEKDRGRRQDA